MRKILTIAVLLILFLIGGAIFTAAKGYYPVAIVEGHWISAREWIRMQEGILQSIASQTASAGDPAINFTSKEGRALVEEVRKNSLILLIEDAIVEEKGGAVVGDFTNHIKQKADEALKGRGNIAQAVQAAYGFTMEEFNRFIVLPQSRRDAIEERLNEKGEEFETWLEQAKSDARVRLLFVPFGWNDKVVE